MLRKSLSVEADTIIYDLEDSVAPAQKEKARHSLVEFFRQTEAATKPPAHRVSVRINDITTPYFKEDIAALASLPSGIVSTIVVPKVEDSQPLRHISESRTQNRDQWAWNVVASIESAAAMWNIGHLAFADRELDGIKSAALLFAAEDYCASTSIQRSPSRLELLYPRSRLVTAAKAAGIHAIDMVNINYQNESYHREECADGRRLGFTGKQAIHPSQVAGINEAFRPSDKEVLRAAKIVHQTKISHDAGSGAFGLVMEDGKKEMVDAPMLKQAEATLRMASMCKVAIPDVE